MLDKASKFSVEKLREDTYQYATETHLEDMKSKFIDFQNVFEEKFEQIGVFIEERCSIIHEDVERRTDNGLLVVK
jgi:hypothetical protein